MIGSLIGSLMLMLGTYCSARTLLDLIKCQCHYMGPSQRYCDGTQEIEGNWLGWRLHC
jgi:hypothetical protein